MRFYLPFLAVFALLLPAVSSARAQVVVYKMSFNNIGTNLNFYFYDDGYVVADPVNQTASFIFTVTEPETGKRYYTTSQQSGKLYVISNEDEERAVLTASGSVSSTGASSTFQAIGVPRATDLGRGIRYPVARKLEGYLLAAEPQKTSRPVATTTTTTGTTTTTTTTGGDGSVGFAGASRFVVSFDNDLTQRANTEARTVAKTLTLLQNLLKTEGYADESTLTTTTTTTTGTTTLSNP